MSVLLIFTLYYIIFKMQFIYILVKYHRWMQERHWMSSCILPNNLKLLNKLYSYEHFPSISFIFQQTPVLCRSMLLHPLYGYPKYSHPHQMHQWVSMLDSTWHSAQKEHNPTQIPSGLGRKHRNCIRVVSVWGKVWRVKYYYFATETVN